MNDSPTNKSVDVLLQELEALQQQLMQDGNTSETEDRPVVQEVSVDLHSMPGQEAAPAATDELFEIPTLTDVVHDSLDHDPVILPTFRREEQRSLFDEPEPTRESNAQPDVDAIVDDLTKRYLPKIEAILREKIRNKVLNSLAQRR